MVDVTSTVFWGNLDAELTGYDNVHLGATVVDVGCVDGAWIEEAHGD